MTLIVNLWHKRFDWSGSGLKCNKLFRIYSHTHTHTHMFCGSFGRAHNKPNWIMGIELAFNFLALCPVFCSFCAKFWTLGFMSDIIYIYGKIWNNFIMHSDRTRHWRFEEAWRQTPNAHMTSIMTLNCRGSFTATFVLLSGTAKKTNDNINIITIIMPRSLAWLLCSGQVLYLDCDLWANIAHTTRCAIDSSDAHPHRAHCHVSNWNYFDRRWNGNANGNGDRILNRIECERSAANKSSCWRPFVGQTNSIEFRRNK